MPTPPTQERETTVLGVSGRMYARHKYSDGLHSNQTFKASRVRGNQVLRVEMRFDDTPRNGHETFAITATLYENRRDVAGGCLHDDIAEWFPEFVPLIPWHLVSTDGPMHYVANAVYLAGDRDYNGLKKGERRQIRNGKTGELAWKLARDDGTELYELPKYSDGPTPPAETPVLKWLPWESIGEGKERELDAARSVAVWPDATDEELSQEPKILGAVLLARLPALLADFRAVMLSIGFEFGKKVTV